MRATKIRPFFDAKICCTVNPMDQVDNAASTRFFANMETISEACKAKAAEIKRDLQQRLDQTPHRGSGMSPVD